MDEVDLQEAVPLTAVLVRSPRSVAARPPVVGRVLGERIHPVMPKAATIPRWPVGRRTAVAVA
jgi:hypothetical protein